MAAVQRVARPPMITGRRLVRLRARRPRASTQRPRFEPQIVVSTVLGQARNAMEQRFDSLALRVLGLDRDFLQEELALAELSEAHWAAVVGQHYQIEPWRFRLPSDGGGDWFVPDRLIVGATETEHVFVELTGREPFSRTDRRALRRHARDIQNKQIRMDAVWQHYGYAVILVDDEILAHLEERPEDLLELAEAARLRQEAWPSARLVA